MDTVAASAPAGSTLAISTDAICTDAASTDAAPAELPLERLEAELCAWSANLAAAECRWFELLAEFDRREGWQQWGCPSCVAWMCWQLGLGVRTAREKLRVAHALVGLPLVAEQMRLGRLSYSKVRAVTRIAEPANEASLVAIALAGTTAQVERVVAGYRRALPPEHEAGDAAQWATRGVHVRQHDDRTTTITITLPAASAMEVIAAIDHFTTAARTDPDPDGHRPSLGARRADAVMAVAGAALAATDEQLSTARPRYLVHLHTGPEEHVAHSEGARDDTAVGVSDATAGRMRCDAHQETVTHDIDGEVVGVSTRSSAIRGRTRRFVQLRDRTCRVPGCSHRARSEIHHLRHRSHGGTDDAENLLLVCTYHHHRLHEGGWFARRLPDGSVQFTLPNGRVLPAAPPTIDGDAAAVHALARDASDGRCRWEGDRLDLDWTLMTLFSRTPWHDPWRSAWFQNEFSGSAEPHSTTP